ncbi:MAG: lipopolysaccharide transport periplasmic protein LptA [Nitrosomonadales bacterium]|nr:lipopolysaccharide transport periplasmic protein LptA [Nitrosomonadales bacterium]
MNLPLASIALCGLLFMAWSGPLRAENADRDKPIHLESDRVLVDDALQTSVFEGKVELTQGTLRIQAEKIVLTQDKLGNKHCTATGKLASFRQKHEGTDEFMEGYGERIEYDTRAETVDFFGQARVKREQDDVQGDHIAYSTHTEVFRVSGDAGDGNDPGKGRVHAVIQPKSREQTALPAQKDTPLTIQTSPTLSKPKP